MSDNPNPTGPRRKRGRVWRLAAAIVTGGALLLAPVVAHATSQPHAPAPVATEAGYSAWYIARYDARWLATVGVKFHSPNGRVVATQVYSASRVNVYGKTVEYLTAPQPTYVRGDTARIKVRIQRPITIKAVVWTKTGSVETPALVTIVRTFGGRPSPALPKPKPAPSAGKYLVTRVVDGDTIRANINGRSESIRLIGIDAPETPYECYAAQASAKVRSVLLGKRVILESDPSQGNRDRHGRLLRYVHSPVDGKNFNLTLIAKGYAHEYTYAKPYKYQASFKLAEARARTAHKGLWGACPTSTAAGPAAPVSRTDKDCPDFATQADAQAYFVRYGGSRTNNVDGLDRDRDGIACESLP
jgi:micrococcal nuclease